MRASKSIVLSLLLCANLVMAYESLRVFDPRGWKSGQGSIEEAVVSVHPRGIYTECNLYLTFSAKNLGFSNYDTLEVEYFFNLPADAIIHDSWLWIGNDIIQAKLLDKWTASQIYENIVKRRRDPSILYYKGSGQYELRIFPMAGLEKRKVKISYLMPAQWTSRTVSTALPASMLKTSKTPLVKLNVLSWLKSEWKNPRIAEFPSLVFEPKSDAVFGQFYSIEFPFASAGSALNFALDAPFNHGIYLNRYPWGEEKLYQLVFMPSQALDLNSSQKLAILFDYDATKSSTTISEVLKSVKTALTSYFGKSDRFNLIFSRLNIARASETWLSCDSLTVEQTFYALGDNPTSSYSNLPQLLANGIDFVKKNGNSGNILLVSNSDRLGEYQTANQVIQDMLQLMTVNIPVHVADYQNQNVQYYYFGSRSYRGNEYFYSNLSRMTYGSYIDVYAKNNIASMMSAAFESIGGFLSSFDLHTTLESGFCYARYAVGQNSKSTYLNQPIFQIGKYDGFFPFIIEASGIFQSKIFSQTHRIDASSAFDCDSLLEEIWYGNHIHTLESQNQRNDIINDIMYYSLRERVLSMYTAFLCLEPKQGGVVLSNPWDESRMGIDERTGSAQAEVDTLFQAFPNPFNSKTVIKARIRSGSSGKGPSFKICNLMGQVIRSFDLESHGNGGKVELIWNGRDQSGRDVPTGTYLFVMSAKEKTRSIKLVYLK